MNRIKNDIIIIACSLFCIAAIFGVIILAVNNTVISPVNNNEGTAPGIEEDIDPTKAFEETGTYITEQAPTYDSETVPTAPITTASITLTDEKETVLENSNTTERLTFSQDTVAELDHVSNRYGAVAVQGAIVENGAVTKSYCFGYCDYSKQQPVTSDTKFRCASLSKLVIAMVTLILSEQEGYDLERDIGEYLGYSVRSPYAPNVPITSKMLMTHTSGIIDSSSFLKSRNSCSSVSLQKLLTDHGSYSSSVPGTSYSYSNFGAAVLACAVEKFTGESFDQTAKRLLFAPLGIDCGFLASDISDSDLVADLYTPSHTVGYSDNKQLQERLSDALGQTHHVYQGNLTISAQDYAKILSVLLNGTAPNGTVLISENSRNAIVSNQYSAGTFSQGYFIEKLRGEINGSVMWGHTGSNFGMYSSFVIDPVSKYAAVFFTSGASAAENSIGLYNVCDELIRASEEQ